MANTKISALTALGATPASGDLFSIVDVSDTTQAASGSTKKITAAYLAVTDGFVATVTGGGVVSLGGFTITVPATGTVALIARAQSFSAAQTFTAGIISNPTATGTAGVNIAQAAGFTSGGINIQDLNNTTSYGTFINIGRNSNGTTPAAGFIRIRGKTGNDNDIWPDSSATPGVLRIGNGTTTTTDTGGSIIGAQTSSLDMKDVIEEFTSDDAALDVITKTPLWRFRYKDNRLGNPEYLGIITDYSPLFGADPDDAHPNGRILNEVNAHGYEMAAIRALAAKVQRLEAKLLS